MPSVKRKAFAYVTHQHPVHGLRLLVFSHPNAPEAGIQVPAGTIRPDESPEAAALREAEEETGLHDLEVVGFLGEWMFDLSPFGQDEVHRRYFFHLHHRGDPPELWRNYEPDPETGGDVKPLFELFWAVLPDGVPCLIADHDVMLPALIARLLPASGSRTPKGERRCPPTG